MECHNHAAYSRHRKQKGYLFYKTHNNIYLAKTHLLYLKYLNCCIFYQTNFSDTDKNKAYTCVYAGRHMSISCADPERGTGGPDPPEKSQKYRVS